MLRRAHMPREHVGAAKRQGNFMPGRCVAEQCSTAVPRHALQMEGDGNWPGLEGQGKYPSPWSSERRCCSPAVLLFSAAVTLVRGPAIVLAFDSGVKSNDHGATEPQAFGGRVVERAASPLDTLCSGHCLSWQHNQTAPSP